MPAGLQDHGAEGEGPHVVTAAGGAEGEAGVVGVLLGPVEGGVEPGAERGVLQGVAGELAVGAVQHEGGDEQDAGRDEAAAGAGGRAGRRYEGGEQRGGGDLVRGQAATGAPAGDVAGVRADAVGGEEPVAGLHGRLQAYGLVVDVRHRLPGLVAGLRIGGDGGDEAAQFGTVHVGAVRVEGGEDAVGEAVDQGGAAAGGVLAGHRPGQGLAAGGLCGDGARDRGEREAGVGEAEAQRVHVPHEPGVDQRDPFVARHAGEQGLGLGGVGRGPHVEAEGAQITLDRRTGDRLTGEDGGRQPNSLPGYRRVRAGAVTWWGRRAGGSRAALSAEAIGCREGRVHHPFGRSIDVVRTSRRRDHHRGSGAGPTNRAPQTGHRGHCGGPGRGAP